MIHDDDDDDDRVHIHWIICLQSSARKKLDVNMIPKSWKK